MHRALPVPLVNGDLLGLEHVHPEQKYLESFADFKKALGGVQSVVAPGPAL